MTMKDFLTQYKYRKEIMEKQEQKEIEEAKISSKLGSFLDSIMIDVLLFISALITIVVTLVVMYMVCGESELKALVANIVYVPIKLNRIAGSIHLFTLRGQLNY